MKKIPLFNSHRFVIEFFPPFGNYSDQVQLFLYYSDINESKPRFDVIIGTYEGRLAGLRTEFRDMAKNDSNFGGLSFINFSPTAEDKNVMKSIEFNYDVYATWLFDLLQNGYTWKWSEDKKNHCLKAALSCDDESSPNYKKMVFFRHRDPYKIMLMGFYYDSVLMEGVWEGVDTNNFNW